MEHIRCVICKTNVAKLYLREDVVSYTDDRQVIMQTDSVMYTLSVLAGVIEKIVYEHNRLDALRFQQTSYKALVCFHK